ncbi:aminoglycoside phosphotransferase family protein [Streptomyces spectabilis]|uniref:Aminoglycoside phosphotransferase (APT) family kinase protein n=1 Tax=Streptomyces spectabilis TaxID=68270 RepID=A0A5P2XJ97_STRST|nr:aminoglycoside phosphotransferase family protein [Streptomyces spectabilis]MBB5101884.1 aminoglycoside phosphotransferase (APT) family kinase protein [Streptomyces spectabilis]MCI3906936.1 aminoglycoside phosphotransferase family protein [Streptomyces spectabilis]QEV63724.1 aminoglycoside phosphotransferase family protein [Streptomyces spectabilis]
MLPGTAPGQPTAADVRDLVREALPRERDLSVAPVDEGGEHSTWWVGGRYVLRIAPDADASARQRRELALRDALRPLLSVEVPASAASGSWAQGRAYTVDVRLPGVSAERRPVGPEGERDLARLLRVLRTATAPPLPTAAPRTPDALGAAAGRALARLAADGEIPGGLAVGATADPAPAASTALLHNDLKGEHLLVSAAGRVSGVLDWADAVVGDPAEDVAGLALSVGAAAAARVAAAAGHARDVAERGLFLARCDTAVRLADRLYGDDDSPVPLLRAQLARAWER